MLKIHRTPKGKYTLRLTEQVNLSVNTNLKLFPDNTLDLRSTLQDKYRREYFDLETIKQIKKELSNLIQTFTNK